MFLLLVAELQARSECNAGFKWDDRSKTCQGKNYIQFCRTTVNYKMHYSYVYRQE